jgi:hypothetical protein
VTNITTGFRRGIPFKSLPTELIDTSLRYDEPVPVSVKTNCLTCSIHIPETAIRVLFHGKAGELRLGLIH